MIKLFCINLLVICIYSQAQDCYNPISTPTSGPLKLSLSTPLQNFQSSSLTLIPQSTPSRYTYFNITLKYINPSLPYQIVASIGNVENYSDSLGLDFSIRMVGNGANVKGIFIMDVQAAWTTVRINYVLTARQDFRVGTFLPDTSRFLPSLTNNINTQVNHRLLNGWTAGNQSVYAITFISGIQTADTQMNVVFNKSTFFVSNSSLQINVSTEQVQSPVQFLLISYMIVSMSSDYQITNIYDLNNIPSDVNVFIGMTAIQTAPLVNNSAGLLRSSGVPLTSSKFMKFFSVKGLLIQSSSSLDILFSPKLLPNQTTIQCISPQRCSSYDGYMEYTTNGGAWFHSECVLCGQGLKYDTVKNSCVCRQGYFNQSGTCFKPNCTENQIWDTVGLSCVCIAGYIRENGICVKNNTCPIGYVMYLKKCYRLTFNPSPTTITSNSANQGQIPKKSILTSTANLAAPSCNSSQYFNSVTKQCISCPSNSTYNSLTNDCQCLKGMYKINGACTLCSIKSFYNGISCQCFKGYYGNGILCHLDFLVNNSTSLGLVNQINGNLQN